MKLAGRLNLLMRWGIAGAFAFASAAALAGPKTLIEMNGTTPSAGLATSWSKVKDGEYTFTLDPNAEIGQGQKVTPAAVKNAVESKVAGTSVTDKGGNVVDITYSGDEATFLANMAKTKVRAATQEVALESSTSEGGIRANPGNRHPKDGEVKGTVIGVKPGLLKIKVDETKAKTVANGAVVMLKTSTKYNVTHKVFFMPEKQVGGDWVAKAGSVTDQ